MRRRGGGDLPCLQSGQLLESSSSHWSTHTRWKRWCPSHGSTRKSSPSSKSTIQIGHVSRPIASGTTSFSPADGLLAAFGGRGTAWGTDDEELALFSGSSCRSSCSTPCVCARAGSTPAARTACDMSSVPCVSSSLDVTALHSRSSTAISALPPGDCPFVCTCESSTLSISLARVGTSAGVSVRPNFTTGKVSRIARVRPRARLWGPNVPGPPKASADRGPYLSGWRTALIACALCKSDLVR